MTNRANHCNLSDRECEVLDALVRNGNDKLIARELGIAPKTAEIHLANARKKMGAPNRVLQALAWDRLHRESQ